MQKSLITLTLALATSAACAFPTKVKVVKVPDLASSEGTEVVLATNKGSITASSGHPAYKPLSRAKKGECLILETESESEVSFNKGLDASGVNSVTKARC